MTIRCNYLILAVWYPKWQVLRCHILIGIVVRITSGIAVGSFFRKILIRVGYKELKKKYTDLGTAKSNADVILFGTQKPQEKSQNRDAR